MKHVRKQSLFFLIVTFGLTISCESLSALSSTQTPAPTQTRISSQGSQPTQTLAPAHTPTSIQTLPFTQTPTPNQTAIPTQILATPVFSAYQLSFDGVDDWVIIEDTQDLEFWRMDFTISLWFKTNKKGKQQQIIRKGYDHTVDGEGRWVLSIDETGVLRIVLNDVRSPASFKALGTTKVTDGRWHYVAAVFDRDEALKVYLDGQLEVQDPSLTNFSSPIRNRSIVNVYIGRAHSSGLYFEGMISDISVWQGARTKEQIQSDQTREHFILDEDLIAFWSMQEGQGQTLFDGVASNHGQLGSTQSEDINDPTWHYSQ